MKSRLFWRGALHALGVLLYVLLVAAVLQNGQKLFGDAKGIFVAAMMIMLLVFSAAVVGSLIFLAPALKILAGKKQEALSLLFSTLAWLCLLVLACASVVALHK